MRSPRILAAIVAAALSGTLALGACGGSSDGTSTPTTAAPAGTSSGEDGESGDDVTDALEAGLPEATVEVPPADGATTIAEYAAGGSGLEPADAEELATVLAIVGTDAEGYVTEDDIVVQQSAADATVLCGTVDRLGISTYTVIPVLPDGTGVDCG